MKADLCIVDFVGAEKRIQRIISRNKKACKIHEELTTNIEKYEEEVACDETEKDISLGNGSLLLQIIESRIFRELEVFQRY